MRIHIDSPSKVRLAEITVEDFATVYDLKVAFHKQNQKFAPFRQKLVKGLERGSPAFQDEKKLTDYGISDNDVIYFKDLGPQISWKLVFIIEYLGPLLIYPLFYFCQFFYFVPATERSYVQKIALWCWVIHFAKRELETLFVHKFSHATMPISNLFKNSGYYWGMCFMVAYFVNHPNFTPPATFNVYLGLTLFAIGEIVNLICHLQLSNLRPAGSNVRAVPKGLFFNFVSCPNYTFEILAWIGFSIMTQTLTSYLFTLVGAGQMLIWAKQKHVRYIKEFDGKDGREAYPRSRKIIVPFVY